MTFIPSYPAAHAFTEMRKSSPGSILHLVHPRPVPWRKVITPIAEELEVPIVPFAKWHTALEQFASGKGAGELQHNHAVLLLEFFTRKPVSLLEIDTEKARAQSRTLRSVDELGYETARKWVAGWRASGFLPPLSGY